MDAGVPRAAGLADVAGGAGHVVNVAARCFAARAAVADGGTAGAAFASRSSGANTAVAAGTPE